MRLDPPWLALVQSGAKTVELRLADQRRAVLHPGQQITFTAANHCDEHTTKIAWIRRFRGIADVLDAVDPETIGGPGATADEVKQAFEGIYGDRANTSEVMAIGLAALT